MDYRTIEDSVGQWYLIATDDTLTDAQLYAAGALGEGMYNDCVIGPFDDEVEASNYRVQPGEACAPGCPECNL